MKYPVLANWIRFKKIDEDKYSVENLLYDKTFEIDAYSVWFALQLDGKKDPYTIDEDLSEADTDNLLSTLFDKDIIRNYRLLSDNFLSLMITVYRPHITKNTRLTAFICNSLLLVSWLPVLCVSIYCFNNNISNFNSNFLTIGSITGILIGLILHEIGHMFAGLSYGGMVFEVGVLLHFFLPGAYVLMNDNNIKKRRRRIQMLAAGIEMNLLLTGIFLLMSAYFEFLSGFFFAAALNNAFLALMNLTFVNGFDGMSMMGTLLGVDDMVNKAKNVIKNRSTRKKLVERGFSGKAAVAACYIIRGVQILLPLVILLNIVEVISWIIQAIK